MSETLKLKKSEERKQRVPLGNMRTKLNVPENPGKVRRWINDETNGRISNALNGGYSFVQDPNLQVGDFDVNSGNRDIGTMVSRVVGTREDGQPLRAYLMEIDKELYDEDQLSKLERVKEIDSQIKRGQVSREADDQRYVPKNGISIE